MEICVLKPKIEENSRDIQTLKNILSELTTSIHVLAEGQKNLSEVIRLQIQHNMEIQSLKQSTNQLEETLHTVHDRIHSLETYKITTIASNEARSGLVAKVIQYAPAIIGALLAFLTISTALIIKELALR
jgi:predicted RNase H-like nuclease (RuvC/YqgF family)